MGCEISEEEVLVGGDEEVGGANIAVVDIEVLMDCESAEDHLVDEPNWVRGRYVSTISSMRGGSRAAATRSSAAAAALPLRSFARILVICGRSLGGRECALGGCLRTYADRRSPG